MPKEVKKYSIRELDSLIESIKSMYPTITEREICKLIGRAEDYISQLRSRENRVHKPQVSPKLMQLIKDRIETLQNANLQNAKSGDLLYEVLSNLKELRGYTIAILTRQEAGQHVMISSLERLEGKPVGTLTEVADKLAAKLQENLKKMNIGNSSEADTFRKKR